MPIYSKSKPNDFVPPPAGVHRAVCVDVVDLGEQMTTFGMKPRVRIIWHLDKTMDDGRPFHAQSTFTNSMHPLALLHQAIVGWRGKPFTDEQMKSFEDGNGFDLEKLIGRNCQLQIIHEAKGGTIYGNINAVLPPATNATPLEVPRDYIRKKDRPARGAGANMRPRPSPDSDYFEDDTPPPSDDDFDRATGGPDDDIPF